MPAMKTAAFDLRQRIPLGDCNTMKARRGTCKFCGARHSLIDGHSLPSLFYQSRFRAAHGREPTWADAVAHLPGDLQERWRRVVASMGRQWSETDEPITEK